ncbi:hypothetical protein LJC28_00530 [Dysgonomonas sp. OttesenSCG-928-D17]|nr:hypothetical protein [Dysgonomonas sp. OttesenSCG-928-D17]
MRKIIIFFLSALLACSCNSKQNKTTEKAISDTIPTGAIPFIYNYKMIVLNGIYQDSIPMNLIFDTGWVGLTVSDSLRTKNEKGNMFSKKLKIENLEYIWDNASYLEDNKMKSKGFNKMGACGAFDWKIFEGKLLEISYRYKYIKVLENTENLYDYDSIKMEKKDDIRLGLPVTVHVQGKKITEYVLLDTGLNDRIHFNDNITQKYNILNKTGKEGSWGYPVECDTIKLGKYYLAEEDQLVGFQKKGGGRRMPFNGIIGNRLLEKFSIVLDLKNYYLYLRPIE